MDRAVLFFAGNFTAEALMPLAGGASALARSARAALGLAGVAEIIIVGNEGARRAFAAQEFFPQKKVTAYYQETWTNQAVLARLAEWLGAHAEIRDVIFINADAPFFDTQLTEQMLTNHHEYRAEYSFADGYPLGLTPDILKAQCVSSLAALASKHEEQITQRDWLFTLVQNDINNYDIETKIAEFDLRDLRLELFCDTGRNFSLCEKLLNAGISDAASALKIIPNSLHLLRTLPRYVAIQITGGCPQECKICPYPQISIAENRGSILTRKDYMPLAQFKELIAAIADFAGDAVINLSPWGEPSTHPEIFTIISTILNYPKLSVIIETSGIGCEQVTLEKIATQFANDARLNFIISLDARTPERYKEWRGEGFDEVQKNIGYFLQHFKKNTYIQSVRIKETEDDLEDFWRKTKELTANTIIQKYSRFAGFLPARLANDLSPLLRRPCWHLKRDLTILLDGTVPLCREMVRKEIVLGNIFSGTSIRASLESIWQSGDVYHAAHVTQDYPSPCRDCDEYYTFNA